MHHVIRTSHLSFNFLFWMSVSPLTCFVLNHCHLSRCRLTTADSGPALEACVWSPFTLPDWLLSRMLLLYEHFQTSAIVVIINISHISPLPLSHLFNCFKFNNAIVKFPKSVAPPPAATAVVSALGQMILLERARSVTHKHTGIHTSCSDGVKDYSWRQGGNQRVGGGRQRARGSRTHMHNGKLCLVSCLQPRKCYFHSLPIMSEAFKFHKREHVEGKKRKLQLRLSTLTANNHVRFMSSL